MSQQIKLYLDEDAQRTGLIQALRARQIDVLTISEAGHIGKPDEFQLAFTAENNRVIFTFNRGDFFQLHTKWLGEGKNHSGIIVSDQLSTGVVMRRLLKLIDEKPAGEMQNWLEFLSNWQ
ncbi:MAG: DUF5615 family PIN-like protein [Chloroflexota bacterium]